MKKKSFITRCLQNHINLYLSLQIQRDSLFRCWMRKYRPGSSRISVYLRLEIIATVNQTAIIRPDVVRKECAREYSVNQQGAATTRQRAFIAPRRRWR